MQIEEKSPLLENDTYVTQLRNAIRNGDRGLRHVPGLLKCILKDGRWRKRIVQQTGEVAEFKTFTEFVEADPLEGLGADLGLIKRICGDDLEIISLIDEVTVGNHGDHTGNQHSNRNGKNDNIILSKEEQGTSRQYAIRRLRKQRPDLHTRVLADELTPHAAMIEAGFRQKTITIPLDVKRVARSIKRHFSQEQIEELIILLS